MKYSFLMIWLTTGLASSSCSTSYPSSYFPGRYSPTTGRAMIADSLPVARNYWRDDQVLQFKRAFCADTFNRALRLNPATRKGNALPQGPGIVLITNEGVGIDEAEISNLAWREYELHQREKGVADSLVIPRAGAQPVADYYTNRFYSFYPVVGISYEQAQAFCRWRGRLVTTQFNYKLSPTDTLNPAYVRFDYRLPTEAEWEYAALRRSGYPFGTTCTTRLVQVVPGAAAYLRQRSGSSQSVGEIRAAIEAYNKTQPSQSTINHAQEQPYFLHSASPGYIYQGPANDFGLYQMLGNAAELVQEKGFTKGGSYRDALTDCRIEARGHYPGPAPHIGFRTASTASRPGQAVAR